MHSVIDLSRPISVLSAQAHYYQAPTERMYIDRVLPHFDLVYLVEGRWMITEEDTDFPLEKDDLLLLRAGRRHYTRQPCTPGTRTICVHLAQETAGNPNLPITLDTLMRCGEAPRIRSLLEEMVACFWSEEAYRQERLSALAVLLLCELSACAQVQGMPRSPRGDVAFEAIRLMNKQPHRLFQVKELASLLYISERTLENSMKKHVGQSLAAYQMNRKLEMAAQQLKMSPDLHLKEIAATLGFYDAFHLSRAFKRKYGVPPSVYREMAGEERPFSADETAPEACSTWDS